MKSLRHLLPSPGALYVFEAAGRHLSFTRAADELGMSQAAVSYAIRQLEETLGVALFIRTHRRISLSEAGSRFYHDVSIGLDHIRQSAEALDAMRAARHITLSVSTAFAHYWMLPRLAKFRAENPEIDIRLQTTDKDVDLQSEGIALGVRRGSGLWPGYHYALLARERFAPVASPAYLKNHGQPDTAAALMPHRLIHLEEAYRPRPDWRTWFNAHGLDIDDSEHSLRLNDYALVIQAALAGDGIALGWRHILQPLLDQGLLVSLFPDLETDDAAFYVLWRKGEKALTPHAARVRDWLLLQCEDPTVLEG